MMYYRIIFLPLNISIEFALFLSTENTNAGINTIVEISTFVEEVIRASDNLNLNRNGNKENTAA